MAYAPVRSFIVARDPSVDRRFRPRPNRQVNLINLISEYEDENEEWCDTESDYERECTGSTCSTSNNTAQTEGAQVFLRLRPLPGGIESPSYITEGNVLITRNLAEKSGKTLVEKHFTFTDVLDSSVQQATVYDNCIRRSIEAEENLTVLTYGTSGSGKTHTQIGDAENPGLIPRALEHIFTYYGASVHEYPGINVVNSAINLLSNEEIEEHMKLRRKMLKSSSSEGFNHDHLKSLILNEHRFKPIESEGKSVFVWVSFAEIYNEIVYDLLNPSYEQQLSKKKGLTIVSNKGRVFIRNLTSICVRNSFEAHLLLKTGTQRVTFGSTAVNDHSSRSHFVFLVDVITASPPDEVAFHSYRFCDLAGSERLDKTRNVGSRLKEAQRINTSLLVLGRCLDAVYHNQQKKNADVVPYRESKLTTLLQAPLMGKEKMTMIVNINPSEEYFEENLHVLGFSSIAKNIVFKQKPKKEVKRSRYSWLVAHPSFNATVDASEVQILRKENGMLSDKIEILMNEITRLERALTTQEMDLKKMLISEHDQRMQRHEENWRKRLDQQRMYYEERIRLFEDQLRNRISPKYSSVYVSDSENEIDSDETDSNSR